MLVLPSADGDRVGWDGMRSMASSSAGYVYLGWVEESRRLGTQLGGAVGRGEARGVAET